MRTSFTILLLVLVSGCRDSTKFMGPFDAGVACGEHERFIDGECQFVCVRDGDCAAGQRCNLFIGKCEPKPPAEDAGASIPCTSGAVRCTIDNRAIERCESDRTWKSFEACPPPTGFCLNEKCLTCQPGVSQCVSGQPKQVSVCKSDGSGSRTITCAASANCTQGECRECTPGATRCSADGKSLVVCTRTADETQAWRWANAGDAADGSCITGLCELSSNGGSQCHPPQCFPGSAQCKSNKIQQVCSDTGSWVENDCSGTGPAGECIAGVCIDECAEAARAKSYFGCDYWTAVQDNIVDKYFKGNVSSGQGNVDSDFAFVVANRSTSPAVVTVTRYYSGALQKVKEISVPGRLDGATKGLMVIKVPWQSLGSSSGASVSGQARWAYRVQSSRPVTVYQFSPLDAMKVSGTACSSSSSCTATGQGGTCTSGKCNYFSYTNDASLLLPAHILGTSYVGMAPEHIVSKSTGLGTAYSVGLNAHLTIVGTSDGTTVTVKSSARTLSGGSVAAIDKGATKQFTLNSYDVLQIATDNPANVAAGVFACGTNPFDLFGLSQFCRVDNDLTGTIVTSDKPIAVFGGSACTIRSHLEPACDHVEEQLFPFVTWGKNFVAGRTAPLRLTSNAFASAGNAGPDYYKIVAGCPESAMGSPCPMGTAITLSAIPAAGDILTEKCIAGTSLAANNCRLGGGSFVEFRSKASFSVVANQPVSVGQFFAGEEATKGLDRPAQGDPSFVLLPPVEQWRSSYTVLTAPGTKDNYLGIVVDASKVKSVEVDGAAVPWANFVAITASPAGTDYRVVNHPAATGTHTITVVAKDGVSPLPGAGVTVYGFDSYVSYGYTGGLDLSTIVSGINPGG